MENLGVSVLVSKHTYSPLRNSLIYITWKKLFLSFLFFFFFLTILKYAVKNDMIFEILVS